MQNVKQTIKNMGGPTKVAQLLNLTGPGAVQRVSNWASRGKIPAQILLDYRKVFAKAMGKPNA